MVPTTRNDKRSANEWRKTRIELHSLSRCDGSSRVSIGGTECFVGVYGPIEPKSRETSGVTSGTIEVSVRSSFESNATMLGSSSSTPTTAEHETSALIRGLLESIVPLHLFPGLVVSVSARVTSEDGCCLSVVLLGVVAALIDAGVPMTSIPVCAVLSLQKADQRTWWLDPTDEELREAQATVCVGFADKECRDVSTTVVLSGSVSVEQLEACVTSTARKACVELRELIQNEIKDAA